MVERTVCWGKLAASRMENFRSMYTHLGRTLVEPVAEGKPKDNPKSTEQLRRGKRLGLAETLEVIRLQLKSVVQKPELPPGRRHHEPVPPTIEEPEEDRGDSQAVEKESRDAEGEDLRVLWTFGSET